MLIVVTLLVGAFVGFLMGLTGAGAAVAAIPAMTIILGLDNVGAVSTAFLFGFLVRGVGLLQHWKQQTVNRSVTVWYLLGMAPMTYVGANMLTRLYEDFQQPVDHAMTFVLAGVLAAGGVLTALSSWLKRRRPVASGRTLSAADKLGVAMLGALLGTVFGTTGVGGGGVTVAAMFLVLRLPIAEVVGTSMAATLIPTLIGGAEKLTASLINFEVGLLMAASAIPAVIVGSRLAPRIDKGKLEIVVAVVLMISAIGLLIKG